MIHIHICEFDYILIPPIVVELGGNKKEPTDDSQCNKNFVSLPVVWRIFCLVHLFIIVSKEWVYF